MCGDVSSGICGNLFVQNAKGRKDARVRFCFPNTGDTLHVGYKKAYLSALVHRFGGLCRAVFLQCGNGGFDDLRHDAQRMDVAFGDNLIDLIVVTFRGKRRAVAEQVVGRDAECVGDLHEHRQTELRIGGLDMADMLDGQVGAFRQLLLRQTETRAPRADALTDRSIIQFHTLTLQKFQYLYCIIILTML